MKHAIFLLSLFFLASCATGNFVKESVPSESGSIEVFFCPQTNCSAEFWKTAENSEAKCAFYDIDLNEFGKLDSPIVERENNVKGKVINDSNFGLMHDKFCSINRTIAWTGSFNPTYNDNYRNDNNAVIIHSRYIAENYFEEYEEMRNEIFGRGAETRYKKVIVNGTLVENYFCPEDKCKERIIETINLAEKNIHFLAFTFTDGEIANALISKSRSIEVKGVMEKRSAFTNYSRFLQMNRSFPVLTDGNKYTMHNKVFIIDNSTTITGSFNPTKSADEKNDENIIIIHDKTIAEKYEKEFARIYKNASETSMVIG
jgi:phosphatidylserine/phosphatidylglycerophosphate/cardiolipin synthase-like enzyme